VGFQNSAGTSDQRFQGRSGGCVGEYWRSRGVLYRAERRVLKIRTKPYQAPGLRANDGPVAQAPVPRHLSHHCDAAEYFNLPRDRTLIVGSHGEL
jgi:hypothetical protein